jgi:hypothetical protein
MMTDREESGCWKKKELKLQEDHFASGCDAGEKEAGDLLVDGCLCVREPGGRDRSLCSYCCRSCNEKRE